MSIGDKTLNKRIPATAGRQTSSPAKVYQSRASKPSAVAALVEDPAISDDAAIIDALVAKVNELIAALKK